MSLVRWLSWQVGVAGKTRERTRAVAEGCVGLRAPRDVWRERAPRPPRSARPRARALGRPSRAEGSFRWGEPEPPLPKLHAAATGARRSEPAARADARAKAAAPDFERRRRRDQHSPQRSNGTPRGNGGKRLFINCEDIVWYTLRTGELFHTLHCDHPAPPWHLRPFPRAQQSARVAAG